MISHSSHGCLLATQRKCNEYTVPGGTSIYQHQNVDQLNFLNTTALGRVEPKITSRSRPNTRNTGLSVDLRWCSSAAVGNQLVLLEASEKPSTHKVHMSSGTASCLLGAGLDPMMPTSPIIGAAKIVSIPVWC